MSNFTDEAKEEDIYRNTELQSILGSTARYKREREGKIRWFGLLVRVKGTWHLLAGCS